MSHTIGQQRSTFALERLQTLRGNRKEFAKLVASLPAMILQNGFGQALAFLLAKGTDKDGRIQETSKHIEAFDIMKEWLLRRRIISRTSRGDVVLEISRISQEQYLYAQQEVLQLIEWVKRYASAELFSE